MALHDRSETDFASILNKYLSPSRAIQSPEFLKGRDKHLVDIRKALYAPGRQVFIHGYRGVGKTSLAQTAAFQFQGSNNSPIILSCAGSGFYDVIHDFASKVFPSDPREIKRISQSGVNLSVRHLSADMRATVETGKIPRPQTVNEAVDLVAFIAGRQHEPDIVIMDEFDRLSNKDDHARFADFVKEISAQNISTKFIFCGIGETLEEFFGTHGSVFRYFHTIKLDRLDFEPRFEIITTAAEPLDVVIGQTTIIRIARISDGFPHFIHLLTEKLLWAVYEDQASDGRANTEHFIRAIKDATEVLEPEIKVPYEKATRKYSNKCEEILWAVADNHQLQRPTKEIYASYQRIMKKRPADKGVSKEQFYSWMNNLKTQPYGEILVGSGSGWYEFRDKIVRAYARLRADQEGIELDIDHPLQKRKL